MAVTSAPTSGWSSAISVASPSRYTATPAAGGSIVLQWSSDGVNWTTLSDQPISVAKTGSLPQAAVFVQAMSFKVAGTFDAFYDAASAYLGALTPQQNSQVQALVSGAWIPNKVAKTATLARGTNAIEIGAWKAPPTWVAMTTYSAGAYVQKGGYLYRMFSGTTGQQVAGTSGATWANDTTAFQVDGSVIWMYLGLCQTLSDLAGAPTATFSAQTPAYVTGTLGLTKQSTRMLLAANLAATLKLVKIGNSNAGVDPAAAAQIAFLGPPSGAAGSNPTTNKAGNWFEFMTDADVVSSQPEGNFDSAADVNVHVIVNGRYVDHSFTAANGFRPGTNLGGGGALPTITVDMSAMPVGSVKRVRIYGRRMVSALGYLYCKPQFSIWAPTDAVPWKLALEGDSLNEGDNGAALNPIGVDYTSSLSFRLGCSNVFQSAIGGTGYTQAGSFTTYINRLANIVTFAPDVLYVGSCHNGTVTTASVIAYIQAARAALPNCWIIIGGTAILQGESTTSGATYNNEIATMAAAASFTSDRLVTFIPKLTAAVPWYTDNGTGNGASVSGGGIGDRIFYKNGTLTNGHPAWLGYDYDAMRSAIAIEAAAVALGI